MAGYIRQSSFVDGDTITAALFNNEFNQALNAFSNTGGHKHDGTAAEGPVIGLIGDAGETTPNNKVLIDTSNNFIEFYVQVSSNPVQQLYIADGAIIPVTDSDVDLGTTSLRFKDTYTDTITTTGNVGIGGNLTVTGTTTFNGGTLTMGDAATDNVVFGADINSSIIPNTDDTFDLGSASQQWRNLFIDGTANVDVINLAGTDVTSTAAELNILDGVTSTAAEINILDGVTSTAAELNILDGVTSTAAEINLLDGVTSTTAELNILDGVTASAADINLIDGITNGTVIASKALIADANIDITGGRNITISGELDSATLDISGNGDIAGTLAISGGSSNGVLISQGAIKIKNGGAKSYVDFYCESSNAHYTRVEAAAHGTYSGNVTATLPVTTGTLALVSEIPTTEEIQDLVGAMTTSNTETNITVTYQDSDGTIDFVVDAAQPNVTSLGTLTALRVDDVVINGTTIGHADDTDLITVADGVVTVAGELDAATLDISGNADIDGTLEADAITVNGTALASVIAGTTVANATTAAVATAVTITDNENTNENNAIIFTAGGDLDGGNLGLESDGDLKYNPSTGTLSATNISVSGTLSTVDSVTMSANNAVVFEGATADAHETTLTSVDATADRTITLPNVSGTVPVLAAASNTQITSTPAELNILDGVTSTAAELNALDGITAVVGELNALDIGSTAVGTAVASKAVILDSNKDYTGVRNFTLSGELDAGSLDVSGNVDVDGTLETDALSINGTAVTSTAAELNALDGITAVVGELNALDIGSTAVGTAVASKAVILDSNKDYTGVRNFTISGELDAATLDISGNVDIDGVLETDNLTIGGDQGDDGQVLTSTGSGVAWEAAGGGVTSKTFGTSSIMVGDDATGTIDAANYNTALGVDVFAALTTADENTMVGFSAGKGITTGGSNVGVGVNTFLGTLTGGNNIAIGLGALAAATSGFNNTAVGTTAMGGVVTGRDNTCIGFDAGDIITSGQFNTAIGSGALKACTTGPNNVVVGGASATALTDGIGNTITGTVASIALTTGDYNVVSGYAAGYAITTGDANICLGASAGLHLTTSSNNIAIGVNALNGATTVSGQTAVGHLALQSLTTGAYNTAFGYNAGNKVTTGGYNVLVGGLAGDAITTGNYNTICLLYTSPSPRDS